MEHSNKAAQPHTFVLFASLQAWLCQTGSLVHTSSTRALFRRRRRAQQSQADALKTQLELQQKAVDQLMANTRYARFLFS